MIRPLARLFGAHEQLAVILNAAKNYHPVVSCAGGITSSAFSSWWLGAGAGMRFFVAKGAPQNDGQRRLSGRTEGLGEADRYGSEDPLRNRFDAVNYSAGPANRSKFLSGSATTKVLAPHGSFFSG